MTRRLKAALFRFLGYRALRLQNLQAALANFGKAAEQQPENPNFALQIAWCLYRLENYEAAIEKYDQLLQRDASCATAHAYRALSLARVHRLREAVEELQRARRMGFPVKGENSPEFWEGSLGTWLVDLGNYAEAIEPLKRWVELEPNDADAHYRLGIAYSELKRHEESVEELQESIRLDPKQPEVHYTLGVCFGEAGQLDRAADSYLQAIMLRPDYADAHFNLGCTYGEIGRTDEEIGEYKRVIDIDPDDRKALVNLAVAYSQSSKGEAAIETWKRIIELQPNEIEGYASLANEFERLGRFQDALGAALEGERIAPGAVSLGNVAVFLNRLHRFGEALLKAREAIGLDPTYPDAHLSAGFALHQLGELKAAICEYQKAIELKPDDVVTLVNMGEAYVGLGRGQEGLALLKRAVELDPACTQAHDSLGMAHLETGNREGALKELQAIQVLDAGFEGELCKRLASGQ